MPTKIRVFVSSTMDDLANEREAVVKAIESLNLEPVNAEGILPNGGTSWAVLEQEIRSSHICILLLGDRYGWVPTEGYGAGQGKSVTHLEIDLARKANKPILPFLKMLKYGADSTSSDAILRDKFRNEICDWSKGHFRGEFKLAGDLESKARQALLDVFIGSYLRTMVEVQAIATPPQAGHAIAPADLNPPTPSVTRAGSVEILFAGAGLSLSAGYPSANALAGVLGQALSLDPEQTSRHSLAQLFEFGEMVLGRDRCLEIVGQLLNPPVPVEPTPAHIAAVRRFAVILTTNYDRLFEQACAMLKIPCLVVTPNDQPPSDAKATVTIYKIDGSIDRPETLILTATDAERARGGTPFWKTIEGLLNTSRPIVIGHSLRDANSLRLMNGRNLNIKGIYVAPIIDPVDGRLLLNRLNLDGVQSSASDYLWKTPT